MGSTFYLFYMVLFTGVLLWCLFLWLVRGGEEGNDAGGERGDRDAAGPPSTAASPPRPLPPEEGKP